MARVSSHLANALESERLYERILSQVSRLIPCDHAAVVVHEDGWAVLAAIWVQPQLPAGTRMFRLADHEPEIHIALGEGRAVLVQDTASVPTWITVPPFTGAHAIYSVLLVPLVLEGRLAGTLNVGSVRPGFYGQRHIGLAMRFAEHKEASRTV